MIHGINIANLEEASDNIDEYELRKRSRYLQKCKEKAWARWTLEYLKALREQHYLKYKSCVIRQEEPRKMEHRNSAANQKKERWKNSFSKAAM